METVRVRCSDQQGPHNTVVSSGMRDFRGTVSASKEVMSHTRKRWQGEARGLLMS